MRCGPFIRDTHTGHDKPAPRNQFVVWHRYQADPAARMPGARMYPLLLGSAAQVAEAVDVDGDEHAVEPVLAM